VSSLRNSPNIARSALAEVDLSLDGTSKDEIVTSDQLASLRQRIADLEAAEGQAADREATAADQLDAVRERRASLERILLRERVQRDRLIDEARAAQVSALITSAGDREASPGQRPEAAGDAAGAPAPTTPTAAGGDAAPSDEAGRPGESDPGVADMDARQTRYERASAKLPSIGPEASKAAGSLHRLRKSSRGA
jgi:hypothetical protein